MNNLSDLCDCAMEPLHTVGFCAVLKAAVQKERERPAKLLYASKFDARLVKNK